MRCKQEGLVKLVFTGDSRLWSRLGVEVHTWRFFETESMPDGGWLSG
ncbi:MAG TPA: hypothetical protein VMA98_00015 [Candidatus Acidoferrales bacterium]|nr:hypothetical protein [Candidatus Acidoferrales bacterium]